MSSTLNQPFTANLRQLGVPDSSSGPRIMEIISPDDKPKPLPSFSGPPPSMHRIQPPEVTHGLPSGVYEPAWRPSYPFDGPSSEQRRLSSAPQPPIPPPGYPVMTNRELPQPPDARYARQTSLPGPSHTPTEAAPPHPTFRAMNGTPHEATPHSAPPDFRQRIPFPPQEPHGNADPGLPAHSLPPTQYPTPVPQISHTPTSFDSGYYQNQAFGIRQRKAARAQQACDQCRARKAKCDEGRPACSHCKENNLICVYKEVPPHKQEKAMQLILDRIQQMEDRMDDRITQFHGLQVVFGNTMEKYFSGPEKAKVIHEAPKPTVARLLKQELPEVMRKAENHEESTVIVAPDPDQPGPVTDEGLEVGHEGELSIPVEHTTAAHKLLLWPSIKGLLLPYQYDEDYVMKLEEERGLIRVYGRGEGDDTSEDAAMTTTSVDKYPEWETNYPKNGPSSGSWSGMANANTNTNTNGHQERLANNGVDDFGVLTAQAETIISYHQSYMDNIHKLHPFLDQNDLDTKIQQFVKVYCHQNSAAPMMNSGSFAGTPRGAKRKRSCETLQGAACDVPSPTNMMAQHAGDRPIEKSVDNAIILLVFALGSICQVRHGPIPGPVTDEPPDYLKQYIPGPTTRNILSPDGSDSVSQPYLYASSMADGRNNANGRPDNQGLRNLDKIPGLAYYAYATQILGSLQGSNGLRHVQAALLAGLYAGQLAHPFQSHGWIYQAARACQVLVRSRRYEKMTDGPVKDLYDFAYWTCLQLESDILAELDLPASGISRSEARISLPKGRFTLTLPNEISAPSTIMMFFYSAQIHLRKVLNRVHTDLYKVEKHGQSRWTTTVQEILSMNLEMWRNSLPEPMRWRDTDPPSDDINVARMRAKYYGARYIIHRPLLYHALHFIGPPDGRAVSLDSPTGSAPSGTKSQQVSPSLTHSATNMTRLSSDMGPTSRSIPPSAPGIVTAQSYRELPKKLRTACRVCVDSAIASTEAFDGIKGRPVVTNIFGTAHAQFGNMLVLSATFMSHLSELVERKTLARLLRRTINFLLQSQNISPTLRADARILTEIYEKIFREPPSASFS